MNNVIKILTASALALTLALTSCPDPSQDGETGSFNISFSMADGAGLSGRSAAQYPPDETMKRDMTYAINMQGPGGASVNRTTEKGATSVTFSVAAGPWTVSVAASYNGAAYASGTGSVDVIAGRSNTCIIKMNSAAPGAGSIEAMREYLSQLEPNGADRPYDVALTVTLSTTVWTTIYNVLNEAGKYVSLDLSGCMGSSFNGGSAERGPQYIVNLILPNTFTSIPNGDPSAYAFQHYTNLKSVSGENVRSIGEAAFFECSSLNSVSFDNAQTIGNNAFVNCSSLISVSFPEATSIGQASFQNCANLESVSIPKATSIQNQAFQMSNKLARITLADNINPGSDPVTLSMAFTGLGDLEAKYTVGGGGTYTTSNPGMSATWTKE